MPMYKNDSMDAHTFGLTRHAGNKVTIQPNIQEGVIRFDELVQKNQNAQDEKFSRACESYCDKHGFGRLGHKTLENCLVIPRFGIWVDHPFFTDKYSPLIDSDSPGVAVKSLIGTYCYNKGVTIFVYRDGRTYVTKGKTIIDELVDAGYQEAGLYVPFCNGEVIRDSFMRAFWDSIEER